MQDFVDRLLAQVLGLQINLYACQARLAARTDTEALHDLRIAVRKLRSILRPLPESAGFAPLAQAARALGQLTGPLRDAEVLLAQLRTRAPELEFQARQRQLEAGYAQLLASAQLAQLFVALDVCVVACRQAQAAGELRGVAKQTAKKLAKYRNHLRQALNDPASDRHRLRLLIKRLRYSAQAYPHLRLLSNAQLSALGAAQSALGDWHDHLQWLACAEQQRELQPLVSIWQAALIETEQLSEQQLSKLQRLLCASRK